MVTDTVFACLLLAFSLTMVFLTIKLDSYLSRRERQPRRRRE